MKKNLRMCEEKKHLSHALQEHRAEEVTLKMIQGKKKMKKKCAE